MGLLRRTSVAIAFAAALALSGPGAASAHSAFLDSTPEPGHRLSTAPGRIGLEFTEPFNRSLTRVELFDAATDLKFAATLTFPGSRRAVITADGSLPTGAYRVHWHTVSTEDGHVLEGSFGFGVRAAAPPTGDLIMESPLARAGTLRVAFRAFMLAALFFFAGGILVPTVLRRRDGLASWLLPQSAVGGPRLHGLPKRLEDRTIRAGWLAAIAAGVLTLFEAVDAGGKVSATVLRGFLFTNIAGLTRVATIVLLVVAALLARRRLRLCAILVAVSFFSIVLGGHANSVAPRWPAVATDWGHLVAAAVWVGGIAQIAFAWVPVVGGRGRDLGRSVMAEVLPPFGRIALPAFALVVLSGSVNALIQLGHVSSLWSTAYGRVLAVKTAFVALIALASYLHAMRLRPRLLADPAPKSRIERRHWRLLASEPFLAVAVVAAVAVLVAFPLPPAQLIETDADEAAGKATPARVEAGPGPAVRQIGDERVTETRPKLMRPMTMQSTSGSAAAGRALVRPRTPKGSDRHV